MKDNLGQKKSESQGHFSVDNVAIFSYNLQ